MSFVAALEDFGSPVRQEPLSPSQDITAIKADAYAQGLEDGRSAAQTDLQVASQETQRHLADALETLSFGYAEARATFISEMEPVLSAMIDGLLPALNHEILLQHVVEAALAQTKVRACGPISVAVPPDLAEEARLLMPADTFTDLTVTADPDLPAGRAEIRSTQTETEIDMSAAVGAIRSVLSSYFTLEKETFRHD